MLNLELLRQESIRKDTQPRVQEAHARLEKEIEKAEGFRTRVMLPIEDAREIANFLDNFAYN